LIEKDFGVARAGADKWLLENAAFISHGQRTRYEAQHAVLPPKLARSVQRERDLLEDHETKFTCGLRLRGGGRAAALFVDSEITPLIDVKGIGTSILATPARAATGFLRSARHLHTLACVCWY
jgi:hypothetical protein